MPIPAFNDDGYLPPGLHECTLEEIRDRFGRFQRTDRRCRLFDRLEALIREARATGFIKAVIVDGSFVTDEDSPNDVDLILVLDQDHDFDADLRPFEYNVVSKPAARRRYGFDIVAVAANTSRLAEAIEFFSRLRDRPNHRKGHLQVRL